jgi:hypothetical protein
VGSTEQSVHGLLALSLAIVVVREEVYRAQPCGTEEQADANALAALIASGIRLWECAEDPTVPPRLVRHDPREGMPATRRLAVQAEELAAVIARLRQSAAENGTPLGPGER